MSPSPHDLAQRFARLDPSRRRQFLEALAAAGMDFRLLPIPAVPRETDRAPASFAQQRMWLAEQMGGNSALNTIAGGLVLEGALDAAALASPSPPCARGTRRCARVSRRVRTERLNR